MTIGVDTIEELSNTITGAPFEINGDGYGSGITSPTDGVVLRTNLCTNPSFETTSTPWGAVGSGVTTGRGTANPYIGVGNLHLSQNGTADLAGTTYALTGLTVGQVYTASAYGYASGTVTFTIGVTGIGTNTAIVPNGAYKRAAYTFTATATSHTVTFTFTATSATAFTADMDAVLIEAGVSAVGTAFGSGPFGSTAFGGGFLPDYFDGATDDTTGEVYAWTGGAHSSTSTVTGTFTEVSDIDTASEHDQIILTRDSNPGVYAFEDPEGTIQIFDSATHRLDPATFSIGPDIYSAIDMQFDTGHIINTITLTYFTKIKVGKKGTKKVPHNVTYTDSDSIAKYGTQRPPKPFQIHQKSDFSAFADAVFARNADPAEVPASVTIPVTSAGKLRGGYEDGDYVTKKVDIVAPDGTVYGCRISRIAHQITPTRWTVQVFLRDQHVIQKPRQNHLASEVGNNPDGLVLNEHLEDGAVDGDKLADAIDGTGKTVTNAVVQTNDSGNRIVVRDDSSEGTIEFWAGVSGETKGYINPSVDGTSGAHLLDIATSSSASPNDTPARVRLHGSVGISGPVIDLLNDTQLNANDITCDSLSSTGAIDAGSAAITTDGNIAGGDVFTNTTDTSTNAANAVILSGGKIVPHSSLSANKLEQAPLDLDAARRLLKAQPTTWYDRAEAEHRGTTEGMRRNTGLIAEDVAREAQEFAVHDDEGNLRDVDTQGALAAALLLIADLTARVEELEG